MRNIGAPAQAQAVDDDRQTLLYEIRLAPSWVIHDLIESGREGSARVVAPDIRQRKQPVPFRDESPPPRSADDLVGEITLPAESLSVSYTHLTLPTIYSV